MRNCTNGFYIRETTLVNLIKPVIENNIINDCESNGIIIYGKTAPQVLNNVFSNCHYYGIQWDRYGTVKVDVATLISGNKFTGGTRGMQIQGDVLVDIIGNTISNAEYGIEVGGKASVTITKDTLIGNTSHGIRLYQGTNPAVINGCQFRQNGVGISVLSDAKFTVTGNSFLENNTGIYFEWNAGQTGELVVSNNTLSGSFKNPLYAEGGTGIYIQAAKVVSIIGNIISNNKATGGGGIHLNSATTADIKGNTITGNNSNTYGGGIYIGYGTNITVKQNTISKNTAGIYGGGIFTQNSANAAIEGNEIKDNYAGEYGGGICGTVKGWPTTAVVTVKGKAETVTRYVPCFTETTNTWSGNSHGKKTGAWGPGIDKWCDDSGYDFYPY
jgi:parallel beta-helix repeat protein